MAKKISDLLSSNPVTEFDGTEVIEVTKSAASGAGTSEDLAKYVISTPLPSVTVSTLPSAATAGKFVFVTDESGGAVPAFSDGTNWLRVTDRAIVS